MIYLIFDEMISMKIILFLFFCLFSTHLYSLEAERTLSDSVRDYRSLLKEVDDLLQSKKPDCTTDGKMKDTPYCSMKDFCENTPLNHDGSIFYRNDRGEKVFNDRYYTIRDQIQSCLREKYSSEIAESKEEKNKKLLGQHLTKMRGLNQQLVQLMKKYSQSSAVALVSAEILDMSLKAGLNDQNLGWKTSGSKKEDLKKIIETAEKKLKIKLAPEIRQTLAEIQFVSNNPTYAEEVKNYERDLIPQFSIEDPLYDWEKLKNPKAAGGESALKKNRDFLNEKTQEAARIFEETRQDILRFLETRKNSSNAAMINRAIERVQTVSLSPPRLTSSLGQMCKFPNAFYDPDVHSLIICPQILNFPKESLRETMIHEIAHSFDTCRLSRSFAEVTGPRVVEDAPFEIEIKDHKYTNQKRYRVLSYNETPPSEGLVQGTMKYQDNPFAETMSCLKKSLGMKSMDLTNIKTTVEAELKKEIHYSGANETNSGLVRILSFLRDNFETFYNLEAGCNYEVGENAFFASQMEENFSDKISGEILAMRLKGKSREEAKRVYLEVATGYDNFCPKTTPVMERFLDFAQKEGCTNFFQNNTFAQKIFKGLDLIDKDFDPHATHYDRFNRNLITHPIVRSILGCPKNSGEIYCE